MRRRPIQTFPSPAKKRSNVAPNRGLVNVAANDTDRIGHEVEAVSESRLAKTTHAQQRDTAAPRA
ncbi:hypothetical protein FSOLCH5_011871 [Fusarium solani]|nr:hypothetical protein NW759_003681 [Fusarium solani]